MDEELPFKTRYQLYAELAGVERVWLDPEHCRAAATDLKAKILLFQFKTTAEGKLIADKGKPTTPIIIENVYTPQEVDKNTMKWKQIT